MNSKKELCESIDFQVSTYWESREISDAIIESIHDVVLNSKNTMRIELWKTLEHIYSTSPKGIIKTKNKRKTDTTNIAYFLDRLTTEHLVDKVYKHVGKFQYFERCLCCGHLR
jgi:hypothetical protein